MALGLTARQRTIIQGTIKQARHRYAAEPVAVQRLAAVIAVMTKFPESGVRVLANANVPVSRKIPHDLLPWTSDGLGHDHASVGDLQQQTGTAWTVPVSATTMGSPNGWGTPYELMDPSTSTAKFFHAMEQRGGDWRTQPEWITAQNVQVSAFDGRPREANNYSGVYGGNYKAFRAKARTAVALLWPTSAAKPTTPTKPLPPPKPPKKPIPKPVKARKRYVTVRAGQYLGLIAANNHTSVARLVALNRKAHPSLVSRPDYIRVGWKLRVK